MGSKDILKSVEVNLMRLKPISITTNCSYESKTKCHVLNIKLIQLYKHSDKTVKPSKTVVYYYLRVTSLTFN